MRYIVSLMAVISFCAISNASDLSPEKTNSSEISESVSNADLQLAEKYQLLQSSVVYWFSGDSSVDAETDTQYAEIADILKMNVHGENEFERKRDKTKALERRNEMCGRMYGLRLTIPFPKYDFKTNSYDFSYTHPLAGNFPGILVPSHLKVPVVKLDEEKAEEIHNMNEEGYSQEIVLRPLRTQTREEVVAMARDMIRKIEKDGVQLSEREKALGFATAVAEPVFEVVASKIVIKGSRELYWNKSRIPKAPKK